MPHENLGVARFVERQVRNWEIGRDHGAASVVAEPTQTIQFYIAISREFGSGGEKVAECLAECLGWPKYDREILDYMAENEEVRRRLYGMLDERERNWLQQLLDPLEPLGTDAAVTREEYFGRLTRGVVTVAQKQRSIFVGRGANFILPRARGLAVRIVAPRKDRLAWVMEQEGLDARAAQRRIDEVESQRVDFLMRHFGRRPYDPRRYDLVLNAASLHVQGMCSLIREAAGQKLGVPLKCGKAPV